MKADKIKTVQHSGGCYVPGITGIEGGIRICTVASGKSCSLLVYEKGGKRAREIPFPQEQRIGNVWSMDLLAEDFSGLEYCLKIDGRETVDPYGRAYSGRERWGAGALPGRPVRCLFESAPYDWEGDKPLKQPFTDMILYRIHTRGFTMHSSSKIEDRGTFRAILAKIPYLKELGITALELMPPNEFEERMTETKEAKNPYAPPIPEGKLNYWGYAKGWHFAPKAAYASGKAVPGGKSPCREFKDLVKTLHQNGIELIIELYFTGKESAGLVQEAVRFWVREYHVDGVHLVGAAPTALLADDPLLADTKLFAVSWDGLAPGKTGTRREMEAGQAAARRFGEYNDGFMIDMRRALKGDEGQINNMIFRSRRNPGGYGVVNYMANTNGFTMMDMVSYEQKHNEANGEDNRDGSDYNCTWNCGAEGPSRKMKIKQMRRRQLRNAFLLLLLSQGTPLIMAGDEFGNSKGGNNNSYCQDNDISWLNWNLVKSNQDLLEFVRYAIAFRKKHPVFHMETEPKNIDYLVCGHPDVSYHGVRAWCPEFESFRRQIGIMYFGEYGRKADQTPDDYFFVAYNMHWEPHEFALPKLPKGMRWHMSFNTDDARANGIYPEGSEPVLENQKSCLIPARSILVFIGLCRGRGGEDAYIQNSIPESGTQRPDADEKPSGSKEDAGTANQADAESRIEDPQISEAFTGEERGKGGGRDRNT